MAFAIATKQGGTCEAFPDTCKTPAPPGPPQSVPYQNVAQLVQAEECSERVFVMGKRVATKRSLTKATSGDEPGQLGGDVSHTVRGPMKFKPKLDNVEVEGQPVAYQTCTTAHNGTNANAPTGVHSSPSQSKVTISG